MTKLFFLLAISAATCRTEPPVPSPVPDPIPTPQPSDTTDPPPALSCATACAKLAGCEAGEPTPGEDNVKGTPDDQTC